MIPPKKSNGEKGATGIKIISPNKAMNKKKGIVANCKSNGIEKPIYQRDIINATIPTRSAIAIGIENSPMNHEYQGRIPKSIDPPAKIRYISWLNVTLLKADVIDLTFKIDPKWS